MRLDVALNVLWGAGIIDDDAQKILVNGVVLEQLDRREAVTLRGTVRAKRLATSRTTSHVGPVATAHGKAQEPATEKDRHGEGEVIQMGPPLIRVVEDNDVPLVQVLQTKALPRGAGAELHRC